MVFHLENLIFLQKCDDFRWMPLIYLAEGTRGRVEVDSCCDYEYEQEGKNYCRNLPLFYGMNEASDEILVFLSVCSREIMVGVCVS